MERRQHSRFPVHQDHFVIHEPNIGRLNDLSLGGFNCQCIAETSKPQARPCCELSFTELDLRLRDLPIKAVWEDVSLDSPFSCLMMKHCGVRFGELSSSQETQLRQLIDRLESRP